MFIRLHAAFRKVFSGGVSVLNQEKQEDAPMWLIVGLGNPDREHEENRHNIGFMAIDRLSLDYPCSAWRNKFKGVMCDGTIGRQKVIFLKPQTYMNLSGQSVAQVAGFYKIAPDKIIVLHDELDLPLGTLRTKSGGGAAGHNGLKSIDADMGQQNYWRVRLGIGHPGDKARVSGYVLSNFNDDEKHVVDILCAGVSRNIELLLAGRDQEFVKTISDEIKVK